MRIMERARTLKNYVIVITTILGLLTMNFSSSKNVKIATFNIKELSTSKLKNVNQNGIGKNRQVRAAANIIQNVRPDILVINEIDHEYRDGQHIPGANVKRFLDHYLRTGKRPIDYAYYFAAPCNTGILAGSDLDNDGTVATAKDENTRAHGGDAYGYGEYPGQYSMALLSKYPIETSKTRTFQTFLWRDLPGNHLPMFFYSAEEIRKLRLSSKSHWDVRINIDGRPLHVFVSHPTPPVFDGEEDRNGRRNFDEIKFWRHYIENDSMLYDDSGKKGGYQSGEPFIIAGDLNASPRDKRTYDGQNPIGQLLNHSQVQDTSPIMTSPGAVGAGKKGPPQYDERSTAKFGKRLTQVDYLLPSKNITILKGGIFWPSESEDPLGHRWAVTASDHRLLWMKIKW